MPVATMARALQSQQAMLGSGAVRVWFVWVCLTTGCWTSEPLIDGTFTRAQWMKLQGELLLPPPPANPCALAGFSDSASCAAAQTLAADLFDETALSAAPCNPPTMPCNAPTACATCHDAKHAWIDSRTADNVSLAATPTASFTKHNALGMFNIAYKLELAPQQPVFTWIGKFNDPAQVIRKLAIPIAMNSSDQIVESVIASPPPMKMYDVEYAAAFPGQPPAAANIASAFVAYLVSSKFITNPTPFDCYLQGNDAALTDSAKRGFAVFVGRGTCIECHSGPLLTDFQFHATGVPQAGPNVKLVDNGRADVTNDPADTGKFMTQSLREIANTGPYMHDGSLATLGDVIAFYRGGGVAAGYNGTKDPRITPLDLTDADARDLEEFLRALTQSSSVSCP
jgi:cytochrome c peroxidase